MNAVWAVGDARPYCLVSLKTLHVYLLTILKQFTPPQSPNGDSFLVCRLGQIAKRLPPAICDPQGEPKRNNVFPLRGRWAA